MDVNRTWMLLQIARDALAFPGLKPLHDEAVQQLKAMAGPSKEVPPQAPNGPPPQPSNPVRPAS